MNKLIVANWKMYPTLSDSLVLAGAYKKSLQELRGVDIVIAPPTVWLSSIIESWSGSSRHIHFAAQNVWPEDQGAYTGEASAYLVKDLVRYALVGHSERRQYAHEDNELVREKVQACLRWQIVPILCIGEAEPVLGPNDQLNDYQWGKLRGQLLSALEGVDHQHLSKVVVAYEPIWAIGTQKAASARYSESVIKRLRQAVESKFGQAVAGEMRFLYGGSVSPSNAESFLRSEEIAGLLVGSVSTKAKEFVAICEHAVTERNA